VRKSARVREREREREYLRSLDCRLDLQRDRRVSICVDGCKLLHMYTNVYSHVCTFEIGRQTYHVIDVCQYICVDVHYYICTQMYIYIYVHLDCQSDLLCDRRVSIYMYGCILLCKYTNVQIYMCTHRPTT